MTRWLAIGLVGFILLSGCGGGPAAQSGPRTDLSSIKAYLLGKATLLRANSTALKEASTRYYALAEAKQFDYALLWAEQPILVLAALQDARAAWLAASPLYEQIEGIVAGVPSLAEYDVILDAGSAGSEGGDNSVPFDLTLPDGRMLEKPGNLFGVTESTLWGTDPGFTVANAWPDVNGNNTRDFGEAFPDANVLFASADTLDRYVGGLQGAGVAWEPSESDALTALVIMVPTMTEYFNSWKESRFVAGDTSTQRDFVAISRLSDIQDILGSLEVVYEGLSPLVRATNDSEDVRIATNLRALKLFVADLYAQEQSGRRFTPEEADLLGAEAQNRATAITGQVTQMAASLGVPLQTGE